MNSLHYTVHIMLTAYGMTKHNLSRHNQIILPGVTSTRAYCLIYDSVNVSGKILCFNKSFRKLSTLCVPCKGFKGITFYFMNSPPFVPILIS